MSFLTIKSTSFLDSSITRLLILLKPKIIELIDYYGLKSIASQLQKNNNLFDKFVYFDNYSLTRLDIWMLSRYYKIPINIMRIIIKFGEFLKLF